jgi:putative ABC transport system permease protein
MAKGRNFYPDNENDSLAYIVNESAVKAYGWKDNDDAIGKPFEMGGRQGTVVGVVKDFHFHTLQHPIDPIVLVIVRSNFSQITVKADLSDPKEAVTAISSTWKKLFPGVLMEQSFVDDKLNEQYQAEERYSSFFLYFSILSLLIACLGLLGLTAYATKQRVKEIGIRKVLGASVGNITAMLSLDFLKLVVLATVIAFPFAWLIMNKWLQEFSYRINISWWIFLLAGVITVFIALITVSTQAIKAAISNPVKSLRTE